MNTFEKFPPPPKEQFFYKEGYVGDTPVYLITPKRVDIKWTDELAPYRSAIVPRNFEGRFISLGFRKFTNYGEQPDFEPLDMSDFDGLEVSRKIDGSLLICSIYGGNVIIRTRGTFDARNLDNGHEIDFLLRKYPNLQEELFFMGSLPECDYIVSWLFEWTTPSNVIVLNESKEPSLTLIGAIDHSAARYRGREYLESLGRILGVPVVDLYKFEDLEQLTNEVKSWDNTEGVVVTSRDYQIKKKIKADRYVYIHRLKSSVSSWKNLVDLYSKTDMTADFQDFFSFVENEIDYEVAMSVLGDIRKVCSAHQEILEVIDAIETFRSKNKFLEGKDLAKEIQRRWSDWKMSLAFTICKKGLDAITKETITKILKKL